MSQYSYTKKPDFLGDGSQDRSTSAAQLFATPMGWVAPIAGMGFSATSSLTAVGTTATAVTATPHGLVTGSYALIVGATPEAYNGYRQVTVTDDTTFTYTIDTSGPVVATVQGKVYKAVEVVVAIGDLGIVSADALTVPTYTAAISYSALAAMVTGDVFTVTLTASEPVEVQGAPKISVTINGTVRQATYDQATSTDTSLKFKYTLVAGDVATAGQIVVAAETTGGQIADVLPSNKRQPVTVAFTAPDASAVSAN